MRSSFILAIGTASLLSSAALAQTAQPTAESTTSTATATTTTVTPTSWLTQEAAGQWRASKMIGLNVYNSVSEKIGTISELIVDESGKLNAVVVGAGGFLGIGERDVAVPYSQMEWSYQPVASSGIGAPPTTTGAGNSENAGTYPDNRAGAIIDSAQERRNSGDALSYPDHALLNMSKDQLKAAPAFKFSR